MISSNSWHCIGNGLMACYVSNGDIKQVFGPPYSSPAIIEMLLDDELNRSSAVRRPKTAVWDTEVFLNAANNVTATITDFAVLEKPALVRQINAEQPLDLIIKQHPELTRGIDRFLCVELEDGLLITLKVLPGNNIYERYPTPFEQHLQIFVRGNFSLKAWDNADAHAEIKILPGETTFMFISGKDYPESDLYFQELRHSSVPELLRESADHWRNTLINIPILATIPKSIRRYGELVTAVENVAVCILSQQAVEGGVMAGHLFRLAYVRDQYGVSRALLKMGLYPQARRILDFYFHVFKTGGKILNAQGIGVDGLYHFGENDASEITGYLLTQFFDYAAAVGSNEILLPYLDILLWLEKRQRNCLVDNMMPFNGDETYIAGHILPRTVINDGSAEATMLYVKSATSLCDFLTSQDLLPDLADEIRGVVHKIIGTYKNNFILDGKFVVNQPSRKNKAPLPKYRFGVCNNRPNNPNCEYFGWNKLAKNDMYFCPTCLFSGAELPPSDEVFYIESSLLMPGYMDFDLVSPDLIREHLLSAIHKLKICQAPSHSQREDISPSEIKRVGYDYGLLLFNLVKYGMDFAICEMVYDRLLDMVDDTGVWTEYYINDKPCGTRYRPWESGINMDALLNFALSTENF